MDLDELFSRIDEETKKAEEEIEEEERVEEDDTEEVSNNIEEVSNDTEEEEIEEEENETVDEDTLSDDSNPFDVFDVEDTKSGQKAVVVKKQKEVSVDKKSVDIFDASMRDMEQAIAMIEGTSPEALTDYVYTINGKPVLSLAGIYYVARLRGNIEVKIERIERTSTRCVYKATARDIEKNFTIEAIGVVDLEVIEEQVRRLEKAADMGYKPKSRDYSAKLDRAKDFMEELASAYARRNALRALIDERVWAYRLAKEVVKSKSPL